MHGEVCAHTGTYECENAGICFMDLIMNFMLVMAEHSIDTFTQCNFQADQKLCVYEKTGSLNYRGRLPSDGHFPKVSSALEENSLTVLLLCLL